MINGPLVNARISDPNGRLAKLLANESDNHVVLQQLFQITLGRTAQNHLYWDERFADAEVGDPERRKEFFEDLLWSLLTSETFTTNH